MRLFVGLELPAAVTSALSELEPARDRGLRWMRPDQMHLTLHFIGGLAEADADDVRRALRSVACAPCLVSVHEVGQFRISGGRVILWAGVDGNERLLELHSAVGSALATTGFTPERRPFRPHVTLARLKPYANRSIVPRFLEAGKGRDFGSFEADRFVLFDSDTREDGARYTAIESYPLR